MGVKTKTQCLQVHNNRHHYNSKGQLDLCAWQPFFFLELAVCWTLATTTEIIMYNRSMGYAYGLVDSFLQLFGCFPRSGMKVWHK